MNSWPRNLGRVIGALALLAGPAIAHAQLAPKPYFSAELRGQVIDADSKQPLDGVVVVGRWDWIGYRSPGFHSSGGYSDEGTAVHVGEAVTNREGRFAIARWGPKVKANGKIAEDAPRLHFFKSGNEPWQQDVKVGTKQPIALKRSTLPPREYASRIAAFQEARERGRGLRWMYNEDAVSMPRMVHALHREKDRLGPDGADILAAGELPGFGGGAQVLNASGKDLYAIPVLVLEWTLRRGNGAPGTRRVMQSRSRTESGLSASPWSLPLPKVEGWELDPAVRPRVQAFAAGFRQAGQPTWEGTNLTVKVEALPETRDAVASELRNWRRVLDADRATTTREEWIELQRPLLYTLRNQCTSLTPDLRKEFCFAEDSDVTRALLAPRVTPTPAGRPVIAGTQPVATAAAIRAGVVLNTSMSQSGYAGKEPGATGIGGFHIEPAR